MGPFFSHTVNTVNKLLLRRRWSVVVAGFLAAAGGLLTGCAHTPPIRDASGVTVPGSLASMEEVEINDTKHFMLLRGANQELPVLLVVHGGLGTPYTALAHTFQREWEQRFVVAHWEQRGSGKLYSQTDPEGITTSQLLADTRAVAAYLNKRFHRRVYLLAHSWGTYLGLRTVASHPELFEAYIGVGQTVGILKDDAHSHAWVLAEARRRNDQDALLALEQIGPPPYKDVSEAYETKYGLVAKYGGMLNVPGGMDFMPKAVLCAPEYSLFDALQYIQGMKHYQTHLLENGRDEIWRLSVEDIKRVEVPVYFIYGEHDHATPGELLEQYARTLSAPHKEIIKVPGAAHFPFIEKKDEFSRLLFEHVLAASGG